MPCFIVFVSLNQNIRMSRKILVTGGLGYIGSHTVVDLLERGYEPIVLDNLENSNIAVLDAVEKIVQKNPVFYEGDCRDLDILDTIFTENRIDCVIHFAAYKAVNESLEKPLKYFDNNLIGLIRVLEAMQKHGVKKIIFSSSCTVYGETKISKVDENSPLYPISSPYGASKRMNEEILTNVCSLNSSIRAVFLRYFNPVGAHPTAFIGESPLGIPNNLFPYITQTLSGKRERLSIYGNDYNTEDGTCLRDFVHVVDLAKAHVSSIAYFEKNQAFATEIFNIGTGKATSILEVVKAFEQVSGKHLNWHFAPRRRGDIQEIYANVDKAKKLLNWSATYSVNDAVLHAWNWEKNQAHDV
jgi:UDP-glucose 4-epimerase